MSLGGNLDSFFFKKKKKSKNKKTFPNYSEIKNNSDTIYKIGSKSKQEPKREGNMFLR